MSICDFKVNNIPMKYEAYYLTGGLHQRTYISFRLLDSIRFPLSLILYVQMIYGNVLEHVSNLLYPKAVPCIHIIFRSTLHLRFIFMQSSEIVSVSY